jgi:hypothetical protein
MNEFSKKLANLKASVALHDAHNNFVRIHRTPRITPAMAAGVTDRLWSVKELIESAIVAMITESTITCPFCRERKIETMLTDACQFFYECTNCGTILSPQSGDSCVFCSYGSMPCPSRQDSN